MGGESVQFINLFAPKLKEACAHSCRMKMVHAVAR